MIRKCRNTFLRAAGAIETFAFAALATACFSLCLVSNVSAAVEISDAQPATIPVEIVADWEAKDGTAYDKTIADIKTKYPKIADKITGSGKEGYLTACHWRRVARLQDYKVELKKMLVAKHHDIGGTIIGYTEDLKGDGVRGLGDWGFPGMSRSDNYGSGGNSAIYLLTFDTYYPTKEVLVDGKSGVVRDPCPSLDGKYVVYADSKDNNGYHICDIDLETKKTRQLTDNLGSIHVSDYEPCVLPRGDIMFSSSRCFGHVDCNVNIISNIFLMDKDGKYMRRVGYDQVNTFYPTLMWEQGQVMYTRWEYNDRNVANCFGIFTMYPDGSHQMEFFGNQTEWPATFNQARIIPGTKGMKALATIGGHQGPYCGDLVLVDANKGRNNINGINATQQIAPLRTRSGGSSSFDMNGVPPETKLFQNPYPLDENGFLISYRKTSKEKFAVYWMDQDGNRELIASDASKSISQPVSLAPREIAKAPQYQADYTKKTASVAIANVYYGDASKGITAGSLEKVRCVAMEYRTDPAFGNTGSQSYQMTPVGRFGCSWEAKWIVGEAKIASDGSCAFDVPPDVPIFLQLIDKNGICAQTMRSWMTLKPGEVFECAGCHEDKNTAPPTVNPIDKITKGTPKPLDKFYDLSGEKGSFYFVKVIQPLLDKHCATSGCHDASHKLLSLVPTKVETSTLDAANKGAFRTWLQSYLNLSQGKYAHCNAIMGSARPNSPFTNGSGSKSSGLVKQLKAGHVKDLPKEVSDKLYAWIDIGIPHSGTYTDDMSDANAKKYLERVARRDQQEAYEKKNIEAWIAAGQYGPTSVLPKSMAVEKAGCDLFSVRFIQTVRQLSVDLPSEGKIKLLDLQGRQILTRTITRDAFLDNATHNFSLDIPAGTYIVKFKGVKVSSEQVVSVL